MFVWRSWINKEVSYSFGKVVGEKIKVYKMLLLFGFIPLFISIDGK